MADELGERYMQRISRRALLGGAAALGSVAVAKATGLTDMIGNAAEALKPAIKEEEPKTLPTEVLEGKFQISIERAGKSLGVRRNPDKLDDYVKDKNGHLINQNLVYWSQIESINGKDYRLDKEFYIENPEIVDGYNPDGSGKMDGKWVRLRVIRNWPLNGTPTERRESYLYISVSQKTRDNVVLISGPGKVERVEKADNQTIQTPDRTFNKADVGKVTFPNR